jgi:hypothetical protein
MAAERCCDSGIVVDVNPLIKWIYIVHGMAAYWHDVCQCEMVQGSIFRALTPQWF